MPVGMCPRCRGSNYDNNGGSGLCPACAQKLRYPDNKGNMFAQRKEQPKVYFNQTITAKPLNGFQRKKCYRNGDIYRGFMRDGYRHGKGKLTKAGTKYTYDGDWNMDKRHGHGEENMPGQWRFSGEFMDGKRNGFGKLVCTDGMIYEGEWQNNKKHGFGKLIYSDGDSYEGEFFEGARSGRGKYINISQNVTYEGEWRNDKLNGHAVARYGDGRIFEGDYVDNKGNGSWIDTSPGNTGTASDIEGLRNNTGAASDVDGLRNNTGTASDVDGLRNNMGTASGVDGLRNNTRAALDVDGLRNNTGTASDIEEMWNNTGAASGAEVISSMAGDTEHFETSPGAPIENNSEPAEDVKLVYDFQKRFAHFRQTLYGIDRNGRLHVSSKMGKNKAIVEGNNGRENVACLSFYENSNIIILGQNGDVVFADSTWQKGLLADKEIKAALPEVLNWKGLIDVACGNWHFVGIRPDGTVIAAGKKMCHLEKTSEWKNIKQVACGEFGTVGLCEDGTVVSCGFQGNIPQELSNWRNIISVACGPQHVVGLCKDGTVVACGKNSDGQCVVGNLTNVEMISTGEKCTAVITNDAKIKAIGKYVSDSSLNSDGIVAAVCCSFGVIVTLDKNGNLSGDVSGVKLEEFAKDFEW